MIVSQCISPFLVGIWEFVEVIEIVVSLYLYNLVNICDLFHMTLILHMQRSHITICTEVLCSQELEPNSIEALGTYHLYYPNRFLKYMA